MPQFRQVSIIGLGLIGGSLGMALRRGKVARRVIGFARHEATVQRAKRRGAIHDGDTELCPDWLGESDLVVLAVPPDDAVRMARQVARLTTHSFVMTDATSVKEPIVRSLETLLPSRIRFVGSHPMAGSERSGIEAADPALFRGAPCIVTPTGRTDPKAVKQVSRMWKSAGSRVIEMDPKRHDALVAQISHAPHLAAVALTLLPEEAALEVAGGGFSDTTRIAASDPAMWEQICRMNRKEINGALERLMAGLGRLKTAVAAGSAGTLRATLRGAQARRLRFKK
ncbi:MAG: prephenate dehydrogenase/arogenate dehydrogenase family protein [Candidatus Omnitrophota bacterium]|nr:prephenate dehydrogenase/arogenate dehydrogenase family protein [Candidatus Omnitrophota bacterium]